MHLKKVKKLSFLLPSAFSLLPSASCLQPPAFSLLPCAFCLVPPALCLLPCAFCLLPCASCLLPPAFCLLPSAFCLLPSASCLLPSAFCLLALSDFGELHPGFSVTPLSCMAYTKKFAHQGDAPVPTYHQIRVLSPPQSCLEGSFFVKCESS